MITDEKTEAVPEAVKFRKAKIISLKRFAGRADLLGALLEDGKAYSIEDADAILNKFMKGRRK